MSRTGATGELYEVEVTGHCRRAAEVFVRALQDKEYTPTEALTVLIFALYLVFKHSRHGHPMSPLEFGVDIGAALAELIAEDVEDERGGTPVQ